MGGEKVDSNMIGGWRDWFLPWLEPFRDNVCVREFFVSGCNLRCVYCKRLWMLEEKSERTEGEVQKAVREGVAKGLGIYVSGGDPIADPEGTKKILRMAKELGTWTGASTNGTVPSLVRVFAPYADYLKIDVKGSSRYAGKIAGTKYPLENVYETIRSVDPELLVITIPIFRFTRINDLEEIIKPIYEDVREKNSLILLRTYVEVPWAPEWLKSPDINFVKSMGRELGKKYDIRIGIRYGDGKNTKFELLT